MHELLLFLLKYVQIHRSYISPNQNIWSQMLSKNRQTKYL